MKCPRCKRETRPWDGGEDHGPDFTGPRVCSCGWQETVEELETRNIREGFANAGDEKQ